MKIGYFRRALLVAIAIIVSGLILRPQISESMVTRGDELIYRREPAAALRMYRRAIAWDRNNVVAVDRLCFHDVLTHQRPLLIEAVQLSQYYTARNSANLGVLLDQALALSLLHQYHDAASKFEALGMQSKDARMMTFAGFAAMHAGRHKLARRLFAKAMQFDSKFEPAQKGFREAS